MKKLICTLAILTFTANLSPAQSIRQSETQRHNKASNIGVQPQASGSNAVIGSGTTGRLSKWVGADSANSFALGNSIIFEDKFGKVGIGTTAPTSPLTVQGMIETTLGGYKFPDGTIQTTAGLASVFHDATLTGNGTASSPLGIALPLVLRGDVTLPMTDTPVLFVGNTSTGGNGIFSIGGAGDQFGGVGMVGTGGFSAMRGGTGVAGRGGSSTSGKGGFGLAGQGGTTNSGTAGTGTLGQGGFSNQSTGGIGVQAEGGGSLTKQAGDGVFAKGGISLGDTIESLPGNGVVATGGNINNPALGLSAGHGVLATGGEGTSNSGGDGLRAFGGSSVSSFPGIGVRAKGGTRPDNNAGGDGISTIGGDGTNPGDGIRAFGGLASGAGHTSGTGIRAFAGNVANGATRGPAGAFVGDVEITGNLNVNGTKNFKIDHPLDPENKYLIHAAIESSEILNIYSGNIRTSARGEAVVTLPDWFEALNKDFRYQLTVVGAFAQAIISREISNNRFTIKTSVPGVKVSWQVTGTRSDPAARGLDFKVEEEKPQNERGTYLSPKAYGQPEEKGVNQARQPEGMRRLRQ
jgi:trimeric autotransporter adhesin